MTGAVIAEIIPAAIGLALVNPIPVLAVILLLVSPRPGNQAGAFIGGWLGGLFLILVLLSFLIPADDLRRNSSPTLLTITLQIGFGLLLLWLAVQKWRTRPLVGEEPKLPGWLTTLENTSPLTAFGLGAGLAALNPKNLAFTVSTAIVLAGANLATGRTLGLIVVFVVLGSLGLLGPAVWVIADRERALDALQSGRGWLMHNYNVVMAIVFVLFGFILLSNGVGGLLQ